MRPDTTSDVEAGCRLVEWDSEFFGRRIARIEPSHVVAAGMGAVEEWCANQRIECAYLLADVGDQPTHELAQAHGFRLVDLRVTLATETAAPAMDLSQADGPLVRLARADDVESLEAIARESHRETRFYTDGHFDRRRCDEMYELWIAKSCRGWADRVFVVDVGGSAAGYLTCHLRDRIGEIGLVAVGAASRGRGAGAALTDSALRWFADQGADHVSVVTQARNAAALRLYQRAGMTVRSIQLWFHKWW
jgi:dTDP-4-amino-4,6-dideoxy-D-galactose acyltransferase